MDKIFTKKRIVEFVYLTIGVAIASFAFSFFLNPRNIVIGGVSGIGILLKNLIDGFDPAFIIMLTNIALLILGLFTLGRDFFIKTAYGSLMFPVFIFLFNLLYEAINIDQQVQSLDMVVVILFSSLIMGAGLGIVVRFGGTTGGSEVIQKILYKYLHIPFSTSLYIVDGIVIFIGLILSVTTLEIFLYAIVFTYLSGVIIDMIIYSGFNSRAVYIISSKNQEIKRHILEEFERGLTSIRVVGEYTKNEQEMLVCVLSSGEYFKLRSIIEKEDPTAFYYAVRASEVRGEGFTYD